MSGSEGMKIDIGNGAFCLVDESDLDAISKYKWHLICPRGKQYAAASSFNSDGKQVTKYMHRLIVGAKSGEVCDHIDGDGLNNRRSNLRLCRHQQNIWNSKRPTTNKSGFKGVCWHKTNKKWHAQIVKGGIKHHLGFYESPETAHQAYCKAAKELHGEFWRGA